MSSRPASGETLLIPHPRPAKRLLFLTLLLLTPVAAGAENATPGRSGGVASTLASTFDCPCSVWSPDTLPPPPYEADLQPVELGVKFTSEVDGYVTGVRFYKNVENDGTHTGSLWSLDGTRLVVGSFENETPSGWQQMTFTSPVLITAETVYVVSYQTSTGYGQVVGAFTGAGFDHAPLHVPADGVVGPNGVYAYGTHVFPQEGWLGSNNYVDVVFETSVGPDTLPPTVISVTPADGASGIPIASAVSAWFSEAMDPASIGTASFEIRDAAEAPVPATVAYSADSRTATLTPAAPLVALSTYTVTVRGGDAEPAARDLAGNHMTADRTWSFSTEEDTGPEPPGWYAGDMHAHRSCGGPPVPVATILDAMEAENLDFVSLLADMGNGEVQNPVIDLPRVTGSSDPESRPGRIVQWDAEWHWDATYFQYPHQALGGHVLALGLTEAHQIWDECTHSIFDWARQQGGIAGFAHMQYLGEGIPQTLTCCTPIEYPVEVALGAADFISEDVNGSESMIQAYYRLLNCGFRPGFAAGSDYPCGSVIGRLLTFAQTPGGASSYRGWLQGIAGGRTVVSRNGRAEFLHLRVNGTATPGDEVHLPGAGSVAVSVRWTSTEPLSRTLELVRNGVVVASSAATAGPGAPDSLVTTVNFPAGGWLCARVMGPGGHEVHTAAVFVRVNGAPIRPDPDDARFYVQWIDELIEKTLPGGVWGDYYSTQRDEAQARFLAARTIYQRIADGVVAVEPAVVPGTLSLSVTPNPASGLLTVAFTLPEAGKAALEVLDILGRRVARHEVGTPGPGRHRWTLADRLSPGIYIVRLSQGSLARVRRATVLTAG